jgi:histidinol-phosphate aminotransferase
MDVQAIINKTFKQGVINNKEYTLKTLECKYKLNQNESPFDLPDKIKNKVLSRVKKTFTKVKNTGWNIYPEFIPDKIYQKVAHYFNVKKENILIGNGSNEMIFTIMAAIVEKGKKVIIPQPTFTVYDLIASNLNAEIKNILLNEDFSFDVDSIVNEVKTEGSLCVICSPNNPTGTDLSEDDIVKIIRSSNGIVVVDEAYIQFGRKTIVGLIDQYPNLIILRTFSKAFGLAGLRIGMMISNPEIIKQLSKVKLPYNLNIFPLAVLDEIFNDPSYVDKNVEIILKEREYLYNELTKFKELKVIPSSANFFLVKVSDSKWLFDRLFENDILVRDVSKYPMLDNCLRISVGNKKANRVLVRALHKIYGKTDKSSL